MGGVKKTGPRMRRKQETRARTVKPAPLRSRPRQQRHHRVQPPRMEGRRQVPRPDHLIVTTRSYRAFQLCRLDERNPRVRGGRLSPIKEEEILKAYNGHGPKRSANNSFHINWANFIEPTALRCKPSLEKCGAKKKEGPSEVDWNRSTHGI